MQVLWNHQWEYPNAITFPICIHLRLHYWPCKYIFWYTPLQKVYCYTGRATFLKRNNILIYLGGFVWFGFFSPCPLEVVVWHMVFFCLVLCGIFCFCLLAWGFMEMENLLVLKSYLMGVKNAKGKNLAFKNSIRITCMYSSCTCSSPRSITVGKQLATVGGGFGGWFS